MKNALKVKQIIIGKGMPKICVPIIANKKQGILQSTKNAVNAKAEIVEWRVDFFENAKQVAAVLNCLEEMQKVLKDVPLLFTIRTKNEGGEKEFSGEEYETIYIKAMQSKLANLFDVEAFFEKNAVKNILAYAKKALVPVVVSNHDFEKTPKKEVMFERLIEMQQMGASIVKIAVMPKTSKDVLNLLWASEKFAAQENACPLISMSMGQLGKISRVAGGVFGSAVTFAALKEASAPGQINVEDLQKMQKVLYG